MLIKYSILFIAAIQLLLSTSAYARLNVNHWERFDRTTVLVVKGAVLSVEDTGWYFSTATIRVDEVILNESEVEEINPTIEVKFNPNDFAHFSTASDYLRSISDKPVYFFLGRYEGLWRLADTDASIWEIVEVQVGSEKRSILCFPDGYIRKLPPELFEKLYITLPRDDDWRCKHRITRPEGYSSHYITESTLLQYFLTTKKQKPPQTLHDNPTE